MHQVPFAYLVVFRYASLEPGPSGPELRTVSTGKLQASKFEYPLKLFIFYFLLFMYGKEILVLEPNFGIGDLDGFTCFEVPETENHILSSCSVYMCVCACFSVRVSLINMTPKEIKKKEFPNSVF